MSTKFCIHYFISGRVQGVWYRANTQKKALELGIKGWARNLNDGRVEVMACGEEKQLKALEAWLWQGPDNAEVTHVEKIAASWEDFSGFTIK